LEVAEDDDSEEMHSEEDVTEDDEPDEELSEEEDTESDELEEEPLEEDVTEDELLQEELVQECMLKERPFYEDVYEEDILEEDVPEEEYFEEDAPEYDLGNLMFVRMMKFKGHYFFLERTAKALPRFILEEENKTRVCPVFLGKLDLKPLQLGIQQLTGNNSDTSTDHKPPGSHYLQVKDATQEPVSVQTAH
jgi:hypothetical protein